MNRVRAVGAGLVIVGVSFGGLAVAGAAQADESGTRVVNWLMPEGVAHRFDVPQPLFAGTCGDGVVQSDTYRYSTDHDRATVDALIAKGVLNAGTDDSSVYLSSVDITLTPCVTATPTGGATSTATPVPTTTPPAPVTTPTATSTPPVSTSPSPTASATVAPVSSPKPTGTTAARTSGSAPTASPTVAADRLAYTGTQDQGPRLVAAILAVLAGVAMIVVPKVRRR